MMDRLEHLNSTNLIFWGLLGSLVHMFTEIFGTDPSVWVSSFWLISCDKQQAFNICLAVDPIEVNWNHSPRIFQIKMKLQHPDISVFYSFISFIYQPKIHYRKWCQTSPLWLSSPARLHTHPAPVSVPISASWRLWSWQTQEKDRKGSV